MRNKVALNLDSIIVNIIVIVLAIFKFTTSIQHVAFTN